MSAVGLQWPLNGPDAIEARRSLFFEQSRCETQTSRFWNKYRIEAVRFCLQRLGFGGRRMGLAMCLAMWLHTTKMNLRVPEEKPFFSAHPSTNIPSRLQSRLFLITVIPGSQCQRLFWAPLEEVIDLIKNMAQTSRKLTPQQMKALPFVSSITCRSHRSYSSWFRRFFFPKNGHLISLQNFVQRT